MINPYTELGLSLTNLSQIQSDWSQATFGTDQERGPIGTLKHLAKEALEAAEHPHDFYEYADCLILLLDASRRAGMTPRELIDLALVKMEINKTRAWPKPVNDEPTEHIREVGDSSSLT